VTVRLGGAPRRLALQRLLVDAEAGALQPAARAQVALGDDVLHLTIDPGCVTAAASRDQAATGP
jgi:hypothetical protein